MILQKFSSLFSPKFKIMLCILRQSSTSCERTVIKCVPPPKPPTTIAVIGANSCVGRMSAMLFKNKKIFKKMYLHDRKCTAALACDLNTANRSPMAESYAGTRQLEHAISKARIVYICGGLQTLPGFSEQDLFDKNGPWVRQVITYCAEFNPGAHVVITTPPVSYLVPLAIEEFRKSDIDAGKRVYGLVRHLVSRSNSFAGGMMNVIPSSINSFVVGGAHRRTFVPIFSHVQPAATLKEASNETLTDRIQDAEDCALRQNMRENRSVGCCLSIAYNGVKFTTSLAKALEGEPNISDCAFVRQEKPMDEYAKYFTCVISMDKGGIKSWHIPKMSQMEKNRLKKVVNEIRHSIYLGSSYITGDDMIVVRTERVKKGKDKKLKDQKKDKDKNKDKKKGKKVCPPKSKPPKQISVKVCKDKPICAPNRPKEPLCKCLKKRSKKKN